MQEIKVWAVPVGYCGEGAGSTNVVAMVKRSDSEFAIAEARKQGAEEERAAANVICDEMWCEDGMGHYTIEAIRKRIKARCTAEPVCYCNPHDRAYYGCRCGKTRCDCGCKDGEWHKGTCEVYKPPEPAPLQKINTEMWGPLHAVEAMLAKGINALIDAVNRIEARGRP